MHMQVGERSALQGRARPALVQHRPAPANAGTHRRLWNALRCSRCRASTPALSACRAAAAGGCWAADASDGPAAAPAVAAARWRAAIWAEPSLMMRARATRGLGSACGREQASSAVRSDERRAVRAS